MADEDLEPEEGGEGEAPIEEVEENITRGQYLGMLGLGLSILYLYFVWPFTASKELDLKAPEVYIETGRDLFNLAHGERAFPRDDRINTFQEVVWNYETSIRAGADLAMDDRYRWAYASYHVQLVRNPHSRYALVSALDNFILTLKQIEDSLPGEKDAKGEEYVARQEELNKLDVKQEKVKYMLASAYMRVGRFEKAIPLLQDLQKIEHEYKLYQRRRDRLGLALDAQGPIELGASPYRMQLSELEKVNLLLGQAYKNTEQPIEAIKALDAYLESTRRMELADLDVDTGANMEARYMALKLLAGIHFDEYRNIRNDLKKLRAMRAPSHEIQSKLKERDLHLNGARTKLSLLFSPAYSVYGLEEQKLMYAEVAYRLGIMDDVIKTADDFESADPHNRNEMMLWKIMARLAKNKQAPVTPELTSIANDNTEPHIKLAALILLGDNQVDNGMIDKALGSKIPAYADKMGKSDVGAYLRAVEKYKEKGLDENNFVGKLKLIDKTMDRANQAKETGDEDLAIELYKFIAKEFTIPEAMILHEIGALYRILGQKGKAKEGLTDAVKFNFDESARYYLLTEDYTEVDFDKAAREESYFQAAESFFEGGFYSNAFDNYETFIDQRPEDPRVTKARFKKGVSALYRKFEDVESRKPALNRIHDARKEFEINMTTDVRKIETNKDLPKSDIVNSSNEILEVYSFLDNQKYKDRIASLGNIQNTFKKDDDLIDEIAGGDTENIAVLDEMLRDYHFINRVVSLGNISDNEKTLNRMIMEEAKDIHVFNKLLENENKSSRDIWAYNSTLEFGKTYQAEYRYNRAEKVYKKIMNDSVHSPSSEVYRKAAYANAKMAYDKVSERDSEIKPWKEAIGTLEDILTLYDLRYFSTRFSVKDRDLYNEFRRDNAELKYLLAKAYLHNKDAKNAKEQCLELLEENIPEDKKLFDITKKEGKEGMYQLATEQNIEALLGDAYYDLGEYGEAKERYRRAHDRNLDAWERPFYSLSIVDCLIGMKEYDEAKNRLERTRWEFDNRDVYKDDKVIFANENKLTRDDWLALVDQRKELIP